jgi:hypothetical protein
MMPADALTRHAVIIAIEPIETAILEVIHGISAGRQFIAIRLPFATRSDRRSRFGFWNRACAMAMILAGLAVVMTAIGIGTAAVGEYSLRDN